MYKGVDNVINIKFKVIVYMNHSKLEMSVAPASDTLIIRMKMTYLREDESKEIEPGWARNNTD